MIHQKIGNSILSVVLLGTGGSLSAALLDFEGVSLPGVGYDNGAPATAPGEPPYTAGDPFVIDGFTLPNSFTQDVGFSYWSGFSLSSLTDNTVTSGDISAGSFNGYQYQSATGGAAGGSQYAIGTAFGSLTLGLPAGQDQPQSIDVTNNLYTAASMTHGDAFAKQFGGSDGTDPDFFRLLIEGVDHSENVTGSVTVDLADFTFAESGSDYILDTWETVDLSSLGSGVTALRFSLSSSDTGDFGMNTPAFFAIDNVSAVPEPGHFAGILGVLALAWIFQRRRHYKSGP